MKWVLLMQLIFSGDRAGGSSLESQYFQTEAQCKTVAMVFLNDFKEEMPSGRIYRKATCIKLKGGE